MHPINPLLFAFAVVRIGFEEIEYTVVESEEVAVVVVAVLNGTTATEVTVALSTLNGSAVG